METGNVTQVFGDLKRSKLEEEKHTSEKINASSSYAGENITP